MATANLAGKVQTVLGPVEPGTLGITITHEHFLIDFSVVFLPPKRPDEQAMAEEPVTIRNLGWVRFNWASNRDNLRYQDEQLAVREAGYYARAGGKTVVDATSVGLRRDARALVAISRATGLNIVMGSGYYVGPSHPPGFAQRSAEDVAAEIVNDISVGVDGSGARSGIIGEIGCSWPWTDAERKSVLGAVLAQKETGASVLIHPGRGESAPMEIVEFISKNGGDLSRTIIGHIERTIFARAVLDELAATGVYLEFDLFGHDSSYYPFAPHTYMPNDAQRLEQIEHLVANGHLDRILLAHDICSKHRMKEYGGHGFDHIPARVAPWMLARGMKQEQVDQMLVANPARVLTFAQG